MDTSKAFYQWIAEHSKDDPAALRLKYSHKDGPIDYAGAIVQIECRRKFSVKFAETLASAPEFYFPSVLSGEQASSDKIAAYHSSFMPEALDAVDFTAGLGNDAMHLARRAASVTAIERNAPYVEALRHNTACLSIDNMTMVEGDSRDILKRFVEKGQHFGLAFIDPARRDSDGGRVYALTDCEPDVIRMMPDFSKICDLLLIKASPMLDISHTIKSLTTQPFSVIAVGTPTECKELLILVDFKAKVETTLIESVTVAKEDVRTFSFTYEEEQSIAMPSGFMPVKGSYIYEPSPSLMKTGAFKVLSRDFELDTISPNTRLFHSPRLNESFPGTIFRVVEVLPFASGILKRFKRTYPAANVAVRNFGMSADALRVKLGIVDKGPIRLYGITDGSGRRHLVLTSPV